MDQNSLLQLNPSSLLVNTIKMSWFKLAYDHQYHLNKYASIII